MRGQHNAPAALYPRERPGTQCTGGWVGLRAGLDRCGKFPPPGFDPRTVQPVASRYTDWATRHCRWLGCNKITFINPSAFLIHLKFDITQPPPNLYLKFNIHSRSFISTLNRQKLLAPSRIHLTAYSALVWMGGWVSEWVSNTTVVIVLCEGRAEVDESFYKWDKACSMWGLRAEAEEITEHRAYNTTYHQQMATFRLLQSEGSCEYYAIL